MMMHRRRDPDRTEHDQRADPDAREREPDEYEARRAEDSSPWWRASWYLQKYAILWAPLLWITTAFGFGIVTPNKRAEELKDQLTAAAATLQRQIDSLRVSQLKFVERSENNERALTVLVRQACINRGVSNYDKQMIGLIDARGECIR